MKAAAPIAPAVSFTELHPSRTVFAPRSTLERVCWVLHEEFRIDALTGLTLGLMGDMPLICHQSVASPPILHFFLESGLQPARQLTLYKTETEAIVRARDQLQRGKRLVYVYPPPPELEAPEGLLVPVPLYRWLNDKANLGELVADRYLPPNRLLAPDELAALSEFRPGEPVFVKACHSGACGAGKDVRFCPDAESRAQAAAWLSARQATLSGVRVEAALDMGSCWCLSLAIGETGVRYLGAAVQLFGAPGQQTGSRIDPEDCPPAEVVRIATTIGDRARQLGYRGIAGFDVGLTVGGRAFVFDLNFRIAASTPQVLLHDAAVGRIEGRITESWTHLCQGDLAPALERLLPFARSGRFVPTRLSEATPASAGRSLVTGIIVGRSQADLIDLGAKLQRALIAARP